MKKSTYGERIRELRLQRDISLRQFCLALGRDASNWSKVERGILPPPREESFYTALAIELKVEPDSDEINELRDLAAMETGSLPADIMNDSEMLGLLPVFFRTLRNGKPTIEELDMAMKIVKSAFER
ncbi:MAG TPA: helix-turn-helix transcriptional regulator [Chlorobiota bacterium]|nr:helix-turn-helix transcriptional regulator [Chlorobiota bacterium]